MEARARRAIQASTRARLDMASARSARLTPTRLVRALQSHFVLATPDIPVVLQAHARRAWPASTRASRDLITAAAARQTRDHLSRGQL